MGSVRLGVVLLAFFLSGALGLVNEVVWIRKAGLVFGSTTQAVATVVAAFFVGLAAGSAAFGAWTRRIRRPFVAYAWVEAGVGVCAWLSPPAFGLGDRAFDAWYPRLFDHPAGLTLARLALVSLVVVAPAFLMGGSLPLLTRGLVRRGDRIARGTGRLYAWNTLGAAAGAAGCGFALIPRLGLDASLWASGAGSMLLAAAVAVARADLPLPDERARDHRPRAESSRAWFVGALFFVTGFVALGLEVLWTRFLGLLVHNTVHTYTLTLTLVLLGIVIGSTLAARLADVTRRPALLLGLAQSLHAILALGLVLLPAAWWQRLSERGVDPLPAFALLLLPSAVLSGAQLPIAVRLAAGRVEDAAPAVGALAAANTVGGIAGSLLVGFVLLPAFGLERAFLATAGLGLLSGLGAWVRLERGALRWALCVAAVGTFAGVYGLRAARLPQDLLAAPGELVDFREGRASDLAVIRHQGVLQLEIDRWWQGENRKTHQIMAAHLPMLFCERPRRVLVIGIGTGLTASRFLLYDIERLDAVDIEPALPELVRGYFDSGWLGDPRTRLVIEDGRNWVRHGRGDYDLISIEVGQIVRPGIASFYTKDFYRRVRARLGPGGVAAQFVPLPPLTPAELHTVLRTFLDVFPAATLWYNTSELLLIGCRDGPPRIGPQALARAQGRPEVRADLSWSHWGGPRYRLDRPENLLGGFLTGPEGLAELARGGEVAGDERPSLEYALAGRATGDERPLADLIAARLAPVDALLSAPLAPERRDSVAAVRRRNLEAIAAEVLLRKVQALQNQGRRDEAVGLLRDAVRVAPAHVGARRLLGEALADAGRTDEALDGLRAAVRMDSTDVRARLALGYRLHALGRGGEAVAHYRAALRADSTSAEAHNGLGVVLAQRDDLAGALAHFVAAARLDSRDGAVQHNLANALFALGRVDEALPVYRRALALDPGKAQVWFHAGLAQARRGLWSEAVASQRRALLLQPDLAPARAALDRALQRRP
jgi:spermidine synthase